MQNMWDPEAQSLPVEDINKTLHWVCPKSKTFWSFWWVCLNDSWWRHSMIVETSEYLLEGTSKQSHLLPASDLRAVVILFFFSDWLNGYLMNPYKAEQLRWDRESTTCSEIVYSLVAFSALLGDTGSSSFSEMRGFSLGLSYPKEAIWNINTFY